MNKKSQLKLFESLAVLVVFFFLLVFGISFYFVLQKSSINRQIAQQEELKLVQLVQKVSSMPELECSEVGVQLENCIDALRLKSFKQLLATDQKLTQTYYDLFGFSKISVEKIYPGEHTTVVLVDRNKANSSFDLVQVPLAVFNPLDKTFSFGVLNVQRYT